MFIVSIAGDCKLVRAFRTSREPTRVSERRRAQRHHVERQETSQSQPTKESSGRTTATATDTTATAAASTTCFWRRLRLRHRYAAAVLLLRAGRNHQHPASAFAVVDQWVQALLATTTSTAATLWRSRTCHRVSTRRHLQRDYGHVLAVRAPAPIKKLSTAKQETEIDPGGSRSARSGTAPAPSTTADLLWRAGDVRTGIASTASIADDGLVQRRHRGRRWRPQAWMDKITKKIVRFKPKQKLFLS